MSRIRSKDTKPELIVRSLLHSAGCRFSLRRKDLPGRPDIVMPKYRAVIFVHGCFFHRHDGCRNCTTPTQNQNFWLKKFERNVERDRKNHLSLKKQGWTVIVVWECQVKKEPGKVLHKILKLIGAPNQSRDLYVSDRKALLAVAEKRLKYSLSKQK